MEEPSSSAVGFTNGPSKDAANAKAGVLSLPNDRRLRPYEGRVVDHWRQMVAVGVPAAMAVVVSTGKDADGRLFIVWEYLAALLLMLIGGVFSFLIYRAIKAGQKAGQINAAAERLLQGDVEEARGLYLDAAQSTWSQPVLHSMALSGLASAYLETGDLEQAKQCFFAAHRAKVPAAQVGTTLRIAAYGVARVLAQKGAVNEAKDWLEKANSYDEKSVLPVEDAPTAILLLRSGKAGEAVGWFERRWDVVRRVLPGRYLDELRLLRALAQETSSTEAKATGSSSLDDVAVDQYRYLGVGWPEMAAFLERHAGQSASR